MNYSRYIGILLWLGVVFQGVSQTGPSVGIDKFYKSKPDLQETLRFLDSLAEAAPKSFWKKQNRIGFDVQGVAFENWSAGGTDAISSMFSLELKRIYKRRNIRWSSELMTRYGIHAQKNHRLKKTEDRLELNSTFGYRSDTLSNWFYSAKFNLRTQFDKGYNYPDRSQHISGFMAPGYIYSGLGAEFAINNDSLMVYISPATHKTTLVLDRQLANRGDFGVEPALIDEDGTVLKKGRKFKSEIGILITNEFQIELFKDIEISNRLSLYTDYLNNFGNIDIDWDLNFNFRVNQYVVAKLSSYIKYDDETKTLRENEAGEMIEGGARLQWKQKLGIGVVVDI